MAYANSDWSANANEAVTISLVTAGVGGPKPLASFNPKFTYPIFGDEESIFGYQGLNIHLRYHACDMRPGVQITYDKKFKAVGDTTATDVKTILENFLPDAAFQKTSLFDSIIKDELYKDWKPPGTLLKTINDKKETYEIWMGSLKDLAVRQFIKRIQILVPFFIEGGTTVDLDDEGWSLDRWTVFFLYKKVQPVLPSSSSYSFVGYSTIYRYYLYDKVPSSSAISSDLELTFTDELPTDLSCRSRISQFLILPAFQKGGNGSRLYEAIFQHYLNAPQTIEITVEDPNESFDDLRDLNDLTRLRTDTEFSSLRINNDVVIRRDGPAPTAEIIDLDKLEKTRLRNKIAPRQFSRLVEMHLLSLIPLGIRQSLVEEPSKVDTAKAKKKKHEYHLWTLFVKQRLYRHNKQSLVQLDAPERIDKLEEAVASVEADYARLIRMMAEKLEGKSKQEAKGKRQAADDITEGQSSSKKARVEEE